MRDIKIWRRGGFVGNVMDGLRMQRARDLCCAAGVKERCNRSGLEKLP